MEFQVLQLWRLYDLLEEMLAKTVYQSIVMLLPSAIESPPSTVETIVTGKCSPSNQACGEIIPLSLFDPAQLAHPFTLP